MKVNKLFCGMRLVCHKAMCLELTITKKGDSYGKQNNMAKINWHPETV